MHVLRREVICGWEAGQVGQVEDYSVRQRTGADFERLIDTAAMPGSSLDPQIDTLIVVVVMITATARLMDELDLAVAVRPCAHNQQALNAERENEQSCPGKKLRG